MGTAAPGWSSQRATLLTPSKSALPICHSLTGTTWHNTLPPWRVMDLVPHRPFRTLSLLLLATPWTFWTASQLPQCLDKRQQVSTSFGFGYWKVLMRMPMGRRRNRAGKSPATVPDKVYYPSCNSERKACTNSSLSLRQLDSK